MTGPKLKYKRIVLKLSGEALSNADGYGICVKALDRVSQSIKPLVDAGVHVAIVIGAGNLMRGATFEKEGFDRVDADQIAMLCTIANGMALRSHFTQSGIACHHFSSKLIPGVVDTYQREHAQSLFDQGQVVIFSGGLAPMLSTDTTAALRAIEMKAEVILKASTVDGVYDDDPKLNPNAKRYDRLDFQTVIDKQLGVMDLSAFCMCQSQQVPIRVFDMSQENVLLRVVTGEPVGTIIGENHD